MQKLKKSSKLVGILFSLVIVGETTVGLTQQKGLNFISEVRGNVQIKRAGQSRFHLAYPGDLVNHSDRLQLGEGASAKVVCDNLEVWNLQSRGEFQVSNGCSSTTRTVLRRENSNRDGPDR